MLKNQKFVFSPFNENTYVIWDDKSLEAAVIDPGCYNENEKDELVEFVDLNNLNLLYLINTHCHIDHIFGNSFIKDKFNTKYIAPEKDVFLLDLMIDQAKVYGVVLNPSPKPDAYIDENKEFKLGESIGKFIFTPGHSPGEYCLYYEKEKICFTGDVLFRESIGRTDLWGGNYETLIDSISNKLFTLPDNTVIYPGHEAFSTIEYEKANNPYLKNN